MKKLIPFNYFGGKYTHLDWVLKYLPQTKTYCELFGGSGVVLINKETAPIEIFNDLNEHVDNFFLQLRDNTEELIFKIELTPYSRREYFKCYKGLYDTVDPIEWARRFFVVINQSFNGTHVRQTGWKFSTRQSRSKIAESVNRWLTKAPNLWKIAERLKRVEISNYDFRDLFVKVDFEDALIYCDPPYLHDTRTNNNEYKYEMTEQDHIELLCLLINAKAKVAISSYDNEIYREYLKDFYITIANEKRHGLFHSKKTEMLWTNYNPNLVNPSLF